ncbi:MAG: hypothetical protein ABSF85_07205 [Terriglobales bacterium]|jgi:hypothetical protein
MGDLVLGWAVIVLPTLFAVGIEVVSKEIRDDKRWRWGVIVFGVILSGLTFWQQSRALKNAHRDQEDAIERTAQKVTKELAPEVAAETSAHVTRVLNREYGSVISDLYKQLGELGGKIQGQSGLREKELALSYLVSADIIYAGDQLQIWNRGKTNIYLWGDKYDDDPRDIERPNVIAPTDCYYLLTNKLNPHILAQLGQNGEAKVPLELYLTAADGKKYIMHSTLWEIVKDGKITIHTQTHGYEETDWSKLH